MKNNQIFSFDLDGTLLNDQNKISQKTINIISSIPSNNLIIINTGRSLKSAKILTKELKLTHSNCYVVASNGGIIYSMYDQKIIHDNFIKKTVQKEIIDYAKTNNFILYLNSENFIWSNQLTKSIEFWSCSIGVEIKIFKTEEDVTEPITGGIFTYIKNENISIKKHYKLLKKQFPNIHFHHFKHGVSDFTNNFFNKGVAIKWLAEQKGFDINNSYCFGDSYNDIDMFEHVKNKIAVENAIDELKAKSTEICLSNNEDGPALFVKKILGI